MIATCVKCEQLYPAAPGATSCLRCQAFGSLLKAGDDLVRWRRTVDVTCSTDAADQLDSIIERTRTAVEQARATA